MTTTDLIVIDESKVELIKRTVAKDATDDELDLFLHQARRMGLDPLARQIHFQKFVTKAGPRVSFITTIDGYRLIADRTGKYAGNSEPIFEGKIVDKDYGAGTGPDIPAKATVTVYKIVGGQVLPFANSAYWQEYYPGYKRGHMWRKMPHVMLAKVAEAGALRKAFPADLSGAYTDDEMSQATEIIEPVTRPGIVEIEEVVEAETDNGEEPESEPGPIPDDEQVILEASITDFMIKVIALINRYDNAEHAKGAMKQLGFTGVKKDAAGRLEQYRALKELAAQRDAEEAKDVPLFEDEAPAEMYTE